MFEVVTTGALAGLISAPHCSLMCGPLGLHAARCGSGGLSRYQVARTLSYAALGFGAGLVGAPLVSALWATGATVALSVGLALVMLVAAIRIWPRRADRAPQTGGLATSGLVSLRPRKSLFRRTLARLPKSPELVGACSALLPCGALWSGVALAVASGSPTSGAILMTAFAFTSGVGVWAASRLAGKLAGNGATPWRARALAVVLAAGAALVVWRPLAMQEGFRNLGTDTADAAASCPLHGGAK